MIYLGRIDNSQEHNNALVLLIVEYYCVLLWCGLVGVNSTPIASVLSRMDKFHL